MTTLIDNIRAGDWEEIDPWWKVHAREQQEELVELYKLMEDLSEKWMRSDSRFDQDPLTVDWSESSNETGPLNTGREENWSDWLAHLIRSSPGYFIRELFVEEFDSKPKFVKREKAFQDEEESDRRADILLYFEDKGISIEVKLDDVNYGKTGHTAHLIEQRDDRDWTHFLLLPKYNEEVLKNVFGSNIRWSEDPRPMILSDRYSDVEVMYWKDVSLALRRTLLYGDSLTPHWEASAYLFITLIEQRLFRIYPSSFVERNVVKDRTAAFSDIDRLKTIDVKDQIEYLSSLMEVEKRE